MKVSKLVEPFPAENNCTSIEMEVVTFAKEVPEYVPDIAPLHEHHNPPGITHISQSVNSPFYFPQIKCENACAFV